MTGPATGRASDATVIETLAIGLAGWIARASRAEHQLAAFAFREDGPAVDVPPATSHRYFIGRVLAAAADPATVHLLAATRDQGVPVAALARRDDLGVEPGDRVALAERLAVAATAGLVGRELDGDLVACTPLGAALLDLVETLEARLRERPEQSGAPSPAPGAPVPAPGPSSPDTAAGLSSATVDR